MIRRIGLCAVCLYRAWGQEAPLTPAPPVLQIYREQIQMGREADYQRAEADSRQTEARSNSARAHLAIQGLNRTGDVWFLTGYDSYGQIDQIGHSAANSDNTAADKADLVFDPHTILARLRPDLSYGRGLSGSHTRYFLVSVVSIRAGHGSEYAEARRILRTAHQQAASGDIHSVYEVESGMADGTFLIFTPAATLEEAGTSRQYDQTAFDTALDAAFGPKLRELSESSILQSETSVMRINAAISLPAKEWTDADPDLWKPAQ
jgi:hypothetical protein